MSRPIPLPRPGRSEGARRLRLGFAGAGWIGRHRLSAIARSGAAEIAAIAEPVEALVAEVAPLAPAAVLSSSFADLLTQDLDAVVIATPSALHAEQAIAALERGLAVFCQKPLGRTAAETRAVVDAARAADRLLAVDLSYRFTEAVRRIRPLVQQGALGHIFAADLVFHNAYGPDKPWFYQRSLAGGGCLTDLGVHLVDLALWLIDSPVAAVSGRLFASGEPLPSAGEIVEDYATARLDLASGAAVQIACSWKLPAGCDAVIGAAFYGTRGGAAFRNVGGSFYDFVAERYDGTRRQRLAGPPDHWGGRAAIDWVARLSTGAGYDEQIERSIEVAAVLDRIYGDCGGWPQERS
jgi:predicted dehydrogenase